MFQMLVTHVMFRVSNIVMTEFGHSEFSRSVLRRLVGSLATRWPDFGPRPGSVTFRWMEWRSNRVFSEYFGLPVSLSFDKCSILCHSFNHTFVPSPAIWQYPWITYLRLRFSASHISSVSSDWPVYYIRRGMCYTEVSVLSVCCA